MIGRMYRTRIIYPFPTQYPGGPVYAGEIPALHHLVWNSASPAMRLLGHFKPDKFFLNVRDPRFKGIEAWIMAMNGGPDAIAFRYLCNNTSGVFQTGYPVEQVCTMCAIPGEPNVLFIDDQHLKYFAGESYGPVTSAWDARQGVPTGSINDLVAQGILQWYTAQKYDLTLHPAPKNNGKVIYPVLTDGTQLFAKMSWVEPVFVVPPAGADLPAPLSTDGGFTPITPPTAEPGGVLHAQ